MYDRSDLGLRGLVKSCRSERTLYSRRCGAEACDTEERRFVTTTEYDQAGRLLRHWFQNPGGSEWNWIYTYDRSGRLWTVAAEGTAGTSEVRTHYYDEAGRLERIGAKASDADERVTESFRYDSAGRKTKTLHIDLDSLRPNTTYGYGVEGSSGAYSMPGAREIQTNYDDRGKPVALAFYGEDQELLRRVVFLYDAAGQFVEEAQNYVGDLFPAAASEPRTAAQMAALQAVFGGIRVLHRYDEAGRRVETRSEIGRVGENCKTTTYNEQGDPESEQHVDVSREFEIDDEGRFSDQSTRENIHRSASHYTYVYDETGNWVELTIAGRSGLDDPFQTSSIETRALAYWVV